METKLWADPACPGDPIEAIHATAERVSLTLLHLRYTVVGDISRLRIPEAAPPLRTPRLWEATCFEAFLRPEGENGYLELNFSPSGQWAAYAFSHYREGMADAPLPAAPEIAVSRSGHGMEIQVAVSPALGPGPYAMNVAAILENRGGERSFWAASHPAGGPDFHHPGCFIHRLPSAEQP
ncbi:MAG TPA: DOMON-like domain-containing protein [Allosphingosinicella sp.]|nr:DOMON-like domain-containing protein [Allosphingosinicella sp.]